MHLANALQCKPYAEQAHKPVHEMHVTRRATIAKPHTKPTEMRFRNASGNDVHCTLVFESSETALHDGCVRVDSLMYQ